MKTVIDPLAPGTLEVALHIRDGVDLVRLVVAVFQVRHLVLELLQFYGCERHR